jgi:hypothetical protein
MKCRYVGSKYMHFMTANMGRGDGQPGVSGGKSILSFQSQNEGGRGDAQVSLDEGNGGGTGGASLRLHPAAGRGWSVTHGAAAWLVPRRKTVLGWAIAGLRGLGPKADWATLMRDENMEKLEWADWAETSRWAIIED